MMIPCANCDRNARAEALVGAECPDCRDMATTADLREENERFSEALRRIAADWHRVECPETEPCDCHEATARAALSGAMSE